MRNAWTLILGTAFALTHAKSAVAFVGNDVPTMPIDFTAAAVPVLWALIVLLVAAAAGIFGDRDNTQIEETPSKPVAMPAVPMEEMKQAA